MRNKMLRVLELFAGTGAFSLAFESTGRAETIYANDFEKSSKNMFDANFKVKLTLKNIHDIDSSELPDCDILTAGFPCQPFSIAGDKRGFEDPRSNVFWKMVEIIRVKHPKCLVLENVKNILSHNDGETFTVIKSSIEELGYTLDYRVLNTSEITSIPQNRERMYMVCFLNKDMSHKFRWPQPIEEIDPISHLLIADVPNSFYYTENSRIWDKLAGAVTKDVSTGTIYQYRRYYVRENKSGVCPTLTANMGTGGHNIPIIRDNKGIRKLTPVECFILQGFPRDYKMGAKQSNTVLYKLAGNAVSVGVARKLAIAIVECFDK